MRWSACIEMLYAKEFPNFEQRISEAEADGLDAVEFWRFSNKDLDEAKKVLEWSSMPLAGILAEIPHITDPANYDAAVAGLRRSIDVARDLGAMNVIVCTGDVVAGLGRAEQHAAIVRVLRSGAELAAGTGLTLVLEPLNDRVDHKGYYLTSTAEGLDIVDEVAAPEVKLLYDIYHSAMMGEDTAAVLAGRIDRVGHVHLADAPGRGEPGSGTMDWRHRVDWIVAEGYRGLIGLEYRPSRDTASTLEFRF